MRKIRSREALIACFIFPNGRTVKFDINQMSNTSAVFYCEEMKAIAFYYYRTAQTFDGKKWWDFGFQKERTEITYYGIVSNIKEISAALEAEGKLEGFENSKKVIIPYHAKSLDDISPLSKDVKVIESSKKLSIAS